MDFSCIEELLDLPEFKIIGQKTSPKAIFLDLQRKEPQAACPGCGALCQPTAERRSRTVRDLPISGRHVRLLLWKRRFRCSGCAKRFWEHSCSIPGSKRWTERLYSGVRQELLRGTPTKELSARYGVSSRTLFRWTFERSRGGRPRKLGAAIGIDEFSIKKGHNYDTHIVDLDRRRTIAVLRGRDKDALVAWFRSRPEEELKAVCVVVTDMSSVYAAVVREVFGERVLVIDRFHAVKLAVDALEEVARSVKKQLTDEEKKRFKKVRRLWLAPAKTLNLDILVNRLGVWLFFNEWIE